MRILCRLEIDRKGLIIPKGVHDFRSAVMLEVTESSILITGIDYICILCGTVALKKYRGVGVCSSCLKEMSLIRRRR